MVHLSPVRYVSLIFGGYRQVAKVLSIDPGTVCRWDRNGRMTVKAQTVLLTAARERGLSLTPEDLIFGRDVESAHRKRTARTN